MTEQTVSQEDARRILEGNPNFARVMHQFVTLYDAADVLDALKPPQHEVAAPYLREIADTVIRRDTAMGEDFLQAMISARPPFDAENLRGAAPEEPETGGRDLAVAIAGEMGVPPDEPMNPEDSARFRAEYQRSLLTQGLLTREQADQMKQKFAETGILEYPEGWEG